MKFWHARTTLYFLRLMSAFFVMFFVARLLLLWLYPHDFENLSVMNLSYAMLKGAWFIDSSIILVFLGIPFLLAYLPFRWCVAQLFLRSVGWYAFGVLFLFVFILIGDLLYFGIVHRHAGHEVGAALSSSSVEMVEMIVSAYWIHLLLFVIILYVAAKLWNRFMMPARDIVHVDMGFWRIPFVILMFMLILLVMRGGTNLKPIQSVFAYNEGSMEQGHLVLNGVFSVMHGLEKSTMRMPHFMPKQEAIGIIQQMYTSANETFPNPQQYPLMRERTSPLLGIKKPNVVVLLLESWDYDFIDITRELEGKKAYGVTPNYNALVKQGRLYTNFYANGQRSIDGITSLIAGVPAAPGAGYLGEGVEMNNMGWLGKIALQQGYTTSFLSGSHRASFYMDKIAPLAGFTLYQGAEDLIPDSHANAPKSEWGSWDLNLMMTGHQLFSKSAQPFLSVMFSVSTHSPWTLPSSTWKKFKGDSDKDKFLNTIFYTDWVLGQFFKAVKSSAYADNTIFVLLGDHASGNMSHPNIKEQHHIPLLIVGPHVQQGLDDTLGGQTDIIPTIIDLAGWKSKHASLGSSLMEQHKQRSVLFIRDNMVGQIEGEEVLVHNMQRVVHFEGDEQNRDAIELKVKAQLQLLIGGLMHNQLMDNSLNQAPALAQ